MAPVPAPRGRLRHQRHHASPRGRAVTEQKRPAYGYTGVRWVHKGRYAAVATGRFTTILQWQRKKDCYFEPLSILARGLSLIALSLVALTLVALTLVALTLVALTPAKSVALIALIAAISLVSTSSRCLLSRCLLSRCLLGRCLLGRCQLGRCLLGRCQLGCCLPGCSCWAASCCEAMLLAVVMERAACPACVVIAWAGRLPG